MLADGAQHHVLTPNPEMLVAAQRNTDFRVVLQHSSLNVPDGFGLILASRFLGTPLPERVSGVDLLMKLCEDIDVPIFLLGAGAGVAERAASALCAKNPSLRIVGIYAGSPSSFDEEEILARINASGAQMLFVAYGAPLQDLWIVRNLKRIPTVNVAMGVGGAFDFLAGLRSRAPRFLQRIGLEWLWRLAQEPKRIGRIFTAVIVFPLLVLRSGDRSAAATEGRC